MAMGQITYMAASSRWKFGAVNQNRSTIRMNSTRKQIATIRVRLRLVLRESSRANGKTKCTKIRMVPKYCQPFCRRMMYQRISESILPDQIMIHCENERYAHSTTKANIN